MSCCNATLRFEEERFVMCELENKHFGKHQGLMFQWVKEDEQWDDSYWLRGMVLLKGRFNEITAKTGESK